MTTACIGCERGSVFPDSSGVDRVYCRGWIAWMHLADSDPDAFPVTPVPDAGLNSWPLEHGPTRCSRRQTLCSAHRIGVPRVGNVSP